MRANTPAFVNFFWRALALLTAVTSGASAQVISNGGFESGSLVPWVGSGDISSSVATIGSAAGSNYANLAFTSSFNAQTLTFAQDFTLAGITKVSVDFLAQRWDSTGINDASASFEVRIDGTVLTTSFPNFGGSAVQTGSWSSYQLVTPADLAAGNHTLTFSFGRASTLFGRGPALALDGVALASIPEPALSGILLALLSGLAVLRRGARR